MMYESKLAVALKSAGKVLREFKDTVYVPFGSEYSIFVKNMNSVRALVSVSIDGEDVGDGTQFIVDANDSVDIERFIKDGNFNKGNRLKFIERNEAVEDHRGIGVEDGLVRVEFQFERIIPTYVPYVEPWRPNDTTIWYSNDNTTAGGPLRNATFTSSASSNEVVGKALRKDVPMFPDLAIRELVANTLIHQDFYITGTAPMIEIFTNRIEITNPGKPLVNTDRFLDSPPKSRNEALASLMRRIGVCEERGSGVDKVIFETEFYQLPAPLFEETPEHTRAVLFSHIDFKEMCKEDRIRACYLHSCLQYVRRKYMTNSSLRERFGVEESKGAQMTRIINGATTEGLIKKVGAITSRKVAKYWPYWS